MNPHCNQGMVSSAPLKKTSVFHLRLLKSFFQLRKLQRGCFVGDDVVFRDIVLILPSPQGSSLFRVSGPTVPQYQLLTFNFKAFNPYSLTRVSGNLLQYWTIAFTAPALNRPHFFMRSSVIHFPEISCSLLASFSFKMVTRVMNSPLVANGESNLLKM